MQHRARPAVRARDADRVIAATKARDDRGRDRARAAAEHEAILGALERRDFPAQDLDGRIVAARVHVRYELVLDPVAHRVDRRPREDRRLDDRRRDRAEIIFAILAELIEDVAEIHQPRPARNSRVAFASVASSSAMCSVALTRPSLLPQSKRVPSKRYA